jgi:serine/threonine protein kinase
VAKITDFGFARFIEDTNMEKTGNYSKVGTPLYMCP